MAEQNLNRGIELHSKAQALSVAFPLSGRGAAAAFPPSVPSVFTNSVFTMLPHGSDLLLFPLLRWVRKQQNYPRAWHYRVARIPPFSLFPPPPSLSLFFSYCLVPCNPFPGSQTLHLFRRCSR